MGRPPLYSAAMAAARKELPVDASREMLNTREVADYLRIKERKVYELLKDKRIPCTRVTGKWLFPKGEIDAWLRRNSASCPESANTRRQPSQASALEKLFP